MANPPEWLHQLSEEVAAHFRGVDVLAPLGCHVFRAAEHWEITLFVSGTEVVGGPQDGRQRTSRFFFDLQGLNQVFDQVRSFTWQAQGLGGQDEVGPHISIEGDYRGHRIWLRIPSTAPEAFPPGRRAHVHQQSWEEVW